MHIQTIPLSGIHEKKKKAFNPCFKYWLKCIVTKSNSKTETSNCCNNSEKIKCVRIQTIFV